MIHDRYVEDAEHDPVECALSVQFNRHAPQRPITFARNRSENSPAALLATESFRVEPYGHII